MRKTILALVAVLATGTGAAAVLHAQAQPDAAQAADDQAPPPPPPPGGMGAGWEGMHPGPHHWMPWMHHGPDGWMHHAMRAFALVYPAPDRKLTPADVQKIAEAFLLFHGNHSWKVINVQPQGNLISFAFATPGNDVIAQFTMDPHSGQIERVS